MELLKEYFELKPDKEKLNEFKEAHKAGRPIVLTGVIQRADAKNQNGRIYPYSILKKESDRYIKEIVQQGNAVGELDHTDKPIVELSNGSHIVEDLAWAGPEKKDLVGRIRLLNTPKGKIAQEYVLEGIPLGVSSRALGSVSKNEGFGDADVVQEDLQIICWDLVCNPSTHGAYLQLHENKKIIVDMNPRKVYPASIRIKSTLKELLGK